MLINASILEMDIVHASPSIWRDMNAIDEDTYLELINMDKRKRVVTAGNMIKENPELYEVLKKGYDIYIGKLMDVNNIPESSILERNHDALWLVDVYPTERVFGYVEFALKSIYVLYYKYRRFSFYLTEDNKLKTRGVSSDKQKTPMTELIRKVMIDYINEDLDATYNKLHKAKAKLMKDLNAYGEPIVDGLDGNLKLVKSMINKFT